ncbi:MULTISPECIES: pyocin knob domain-containing protein, partial [unclassified Pasteurella]|uniref:pyocin knob domain-containing protein n=1 Tax=unclassified Pasteurella TaxID=2621516 RepID=UPI001D1664CC
LEFNPNSESDPRFNIVYKMQDNSSRYCSFPKLERNETVAYRAWVDSRIADNFTRGKVTTQNLNDMVSYGIYAQDANRDASTDRNYPTNYGGTLFVLPSAYGVMQKYINFRTGEEYQRNRHIDLRTWSEWKRVDGLDKVSKRGDTMTGDLSIRNGDYSKLRLYNSSGKEFRFESTPDSHSNIGKASYRSPDGTTEYYAQYFPKKSGTVALVEDLNGVHYSNHAYVETTINNSDYGGANFKRRGNAGNWDSRIEPLPDKRWKFWTQNSHEIYLPAKGGTVALLEDFTQNLSGNGWCKLPNGLIMQWGKANGGWVNFPIAFPNSCFSVVGTQGEGRNYEPYIITNISNTKFYHKG